MGDGGFRPAFNVQFATTVKGQAIVGVEVTNSGSDVGLIKPMFDMIRENFNIIPKSWLADTGFLFHKDIESLEKSECKVYLPPRLSKNSDSYKPKESDSKELARWRERMGTEEAKEKYKKRPQTAEFPNAEARNRILSQFLVRGIEKAKNTSLIFAITHNMNRLNTMFTPQV